VYIRARTDGLDGENVFWTFDKHVYGKRTGKENRARAIFGQSSAANNFGYAVTGRRLRSNRRLSQNVYPPTDAISYRVKCTTTVVSVILEQPPPVSEIDASQFVLIIRRRTNLISETVSELSIKRGELVLR